MIPLRRGLVPAAQVPSGSQFENIRPRLSKLVKYLVGSAIPPGLDNVRTNVFSHPDQMIATLFDNADVIDVPQ